MKKTFLSFAISILAMPFWLYCMEPEKPSITPYLTKLEESEPTRDPSVYFAKLEPGSQQQRIFIRNNRNDAVVVEYIYEKGTDKDIPLSRVVYPQEYVWISDPRNISHLVLSPHGVFRQYVAIPKVIKGPKDYATEMQGEIGQGGVEMVISQPALLGYMPSQIATLAPYRVEFNSIPYSSVEGNIFLGKCSYLGGLFKRADEALKAGMPIRPEYILGVLPRPSSADRSMLEVYGKSLSKAQSDLTAGWQEVKANIEGLERKAILALIQRAYTVLSTGKGEELFFPFATRSFQQSKEAVSKVAGCKIE